MFTNFDKAIAGGISAWLSTGVIALIESIFATDLPTSTEGTIMTIIAAVLVYVVPNRNTVTVTAKPVK